MIDLHIHTDASADGQYGPDEILRHAKQIGLRALAFADHNTLGNVAAGKTLCKKYGIAFVEAVELNTDYNGLDLHLLGYGLDPQNPEITAWIDSVDQGIFAKARAWASNLAGLGLALAYDEVAALTPGRAPTGSSFLRALGAREQNHNHPLVAPYLPGGEKADNPYVNFYFDVLAGGPARVTGMDLTTLDAIERLGRFGAIPILAHPADLDWGILDTLVARGLRGIEAVSSYHDSETTRRYLEYGKKKGLLVTAGSDFHGPKFKKTVKLGGISPNDRWMYDELMRALEKR